MPTYLSRLTPLASVVLITAVCAAPAGAAGDKRDVAPRGGVASCEPTLMSDGAEFGLNDDGYIGSSTSFDRDDDTWDSAGDLSYRLADDPEWDEDSFDDYDPSGECESAQGGREVVFPGEEIDEDLVLVRKVFVPATGAFARTYDTITNQGEETRTVDLAVEADQYSDEDAAIGASSSGDRVTTPGDAWFTQIDADDDDGEYNSANGTFNFGSEVMPLDRADEIGSDYVDSRRAVAPEDDDVRHVVFRDIEIEPGETVAYVNAFGQADTPDDATALADSLGDAPDALFAALTLPTSRTASGTGIATGTATASRARSTTARRRRTPIRPTSTRTASATSATRSAPTTTASRTTSRRTSGREEPLRGDSDGDGVADGRDQCPALAGTINGCRPRSRCCSSRSRSRLWAARCRRA